MAGVTRLGKAEGCALHSTAGKPKEKKCPSTSHSAHWTSHSSKRPLEKLRVRWVCVFFTRKALHCSACNRTAFRLLRFHCGHTAKAAKGFACVPQQSGHGCEKLLRLTTGWFRYGFAYSTQVAGLTDSPVKRYSPREISNRIMIISKTSKAISRGQFYVLLRMAVTPDKKDKAYTKQRPTQTKAYTRQKPSAVR